ncbi:hypothetical protein O181_040985 [Austropuccinia psidii MF-1]|uniref:Uncharacterized protein n=1 Tax=Austropuccinia psidii MF-1 TaxID=1389203 RepID=A0A9Q3DE45_9BASI|nr:hypothetical protein [Austropuccinia psidii MF-1]
MTVVEPMHCISGILEWNAQKAWQLEATSVTIKSSKSLFDDELEDIDGKDLFNDDYHEITNLKDNYQESKSCLNFLDVGALQDELMEIYEADKENHENKEIPNLRNFLSKNDLILIHTAIRKVHLPSWLKEPPTNWGPPSAGKLGSAHWITLLVIIIPFVVLEIKFNQKSF